MAVAYSTSPSQLESYRLQSVMGLTPGQLVLKVFDIAVTALAAKDGRRSSRVLAQLIESLDFEHREVALGMFQLYRYCMDQVKRGEFEVPLRVMRGLRETWEQAINSTPGKVS